MSAQQVMSAPDMEYAHPGAPDRYTPRSMRDLYAQSGALSCTVMRDAYDTRPAIERHQDEIGHARPCEIAALTRQMSQINHLTMILAADLRRLSDAAADHATRIAELCARLDRQEATD